MRKQEGQRQSGRKSISVVGGGISRGGTDYLGVCEIGVEHQGGEKVHLAESTIGIRVRSRSVSGYLHLRERSGGEYNFI
ncbi:MAG: hypothetical protein GY820_08370 [Gammaproteobacteria bacterium]|nr:hypothetical protein [Gammaproteobacteria bacterium]